MAAVRSSLLDRAPVHSAPVKLENTAFVLKYVFLMQKGSHVGQTADLRKRLMIYCRYFREDLYMV